DLDAQTKFADLPAPGGKVDHVSLYFNAGHPGVPDPHYHVVLWHVPKAKEALVAKRSGVTAMIHPGPISRRAALRGATCGAAWLAVRVAARGSSAQQKVS